MPSLLGLAEAARSAGSYDQSISYAQQAADLAEQQGQDRGQGHALCLLANSLLRVGGYERAAKSADLAITLLTAVGDEAGVCESLSFQSQAYLHLGLQDEALTALGAGLEAAQRLGDSGLLFLTLNRIGATHCDRGDWAQAEPFLRHAHELVIADGLGNEETFCILANLANLARGYVEDLRERGLSVRAEAQLHDGLAYARQAVEAAKAAANPYREALSRTNLALLLGLAGDFDPAFAESDRSLQISAANGYRPLELEGHKDAAELLMLRGDLPAAIERYTEVLELAELVNESYAILAAHQALSAAYEKLGDFGAALQHFREFHRIEQAVHSDVTSKRAKRLMHRFELHNAKLEADKARLEARLAMVRSSELEEEKQALEVRASELGRDAHTDPLTGLWNRRQMDEEFPELFERARATERPLCVAIGDVDRFKNINDRFGHAAGDDVLLQLAAILRGGCRPGDLVARMGGEEFFLAFIDTGFDAAQVTCERLRKAVEDYAWGGIRLGLAVTVSFGLAESAPSVDNHHQLLAGADICLYVAKRGGRNRVEPALDY